MTPDPSTEAPHFKDKNGADSCNRVASFWEDRAKREHAWVHRLEDENAALAARLSQAEEERERALVAAEEAVASGQTATRGWEAAEATAKRLARVERLAYEYVHANEALGPTAATEAYLALTAALPEHRRALAASSAGEPGA